MRNQTAFGFCALLLIIGFIIGYWAAAERYAPPSCPLEDSCYPSYENGEWKILPVEQQLLPND